MTRVHDMGGRFGDGMVHPEGPEEPVFHDAWHARALAVTLAAGSLGQWNIDMSRRARENLAPTDYAGFSYYEKWLAGLADLLVETGVLTRADLTGQGNGDSPHPLVGRTLRAADVPAVLARGGPTARPGGPPQRFEAGQMVRTLRPAANRRHPGGHTRLPAYAAGARGRVLRCHGAHVLPDANAHGAGEAPEPLYTVVFPAAELWADPGHPADEVTLDLWQCYLEPA